MRVLAIGSSVLELAQTCLLTLRKLRGDGNGVSLIIVRDRMDGRDSKEQEAKALFEKSGISSVYSIEEFEYAGVSQKNANVLSSYIRVLTPSLVFMPFWKSIDEKDRILSRTSLIACRGIGNVLMFEVGKNTNFMPTANFMVSHEEITSTVDATGLALEISDGKGIQTIGSRHDTHVTSTDNGVRNMINVEIESFEIHRTVLLDEPWL